MEARQQKKVTRFGQVLTFLDANPNTVPPAAVATQRQILSGAMGQIAAFARDQVTKGNESVVAQTLSSARIALRDTTMRQLSTVGLYHLTGKHPGDAEIPNGANIFTLPATRTNALTLINAANAMLAAATPYAAIFAAAGVDLPAAANAVQALQNALNANDLAKRTSKGATQGIVSQIQTAEGAVRMMDVVIRPLLVSNKALLTQWESVKRAVGGANLATPNPVTLATTAASASPATSSAPATTATTSQAAAPASQGGATA